MANLPGYIDHHEANPAFGQIKTDAESLISKHDEAVRRITSGNVGGNVGGNATGNVVSPTNQKQFTAPVFRAQQAAASAGKRVKDTTTLSPSSSTALRDNFADPAFFEAFFNRGQ